MGARSSSLKVTTKDHSEEIADFFATAEEGKVFPSLNIELDFQIKQMINREGGMWKCHLCGKTSYQKGVIRNHT